MKLKVVFSTFNLNHGLRLHQVPYSNYYIWSEYLIYKCEVQILQVYKDQLTVYLIFYISIKFCTRFLWKKKRKKKEKILTHLFSLKLPQTHYIQINKHVHCACLKMLYKMGSINVGYSFVINWLSKKKKKKKKIPVWLTNLL